MKRAFLILAAVVACVLPAHAFDGTGFDTGTFTQDTSDLTLTGTSTLDGPVVIGEELGAELLTQTCAGWGLTSPVGAWSCSGDTITRTASGSNLTITNTAAVAGTTYKVAVTYATLTAGTFTASIGGISGVARSSAATYTEYITAGTTGAVTITANSAAAGTITISTTLVKAVTSTLTSAGNPLVIEADLLSETAHEAAVTINYVADKTAAMNDTGLVINQIDTASGGTSLLLDAQVGGASKFKITNAGRLQVNGTVPIITLSSDDYSANYADIFISASNGLSFRAYGANFRRYTFGQEEDVASGNAFFTIGQGTATAELTEDDAIQDYVAIKPEINQTSTAGYNAVHVLVGEPTPYTGGGGSGAQNLLLMETAHEDFSVPVTKFGVSRLGIITESISAAITADSGSAQGGSPLTSSLNVITVVATAGDSVTLPAAAAGLKITITNRDAADSADVFPATDDSINGGAANAAKALAAAASMMCYGVDATSWECLTLAR